MDLYKQRVSFIIQSNFASDGLRSDTAFMVPCHFCVCFSLLWAHLSVLCVNECHQHNLALEEMNSWLREEFFQGREGRSIRGHLHLVCLLEQDC